MISGAPWQRLRPVGAPSCLIRAHMHREEDDEQGTVTQRLMTKMIVERGWWRWW